MSDHLKGGCTADCWYKKKNEKPFVYFFFSDFYFQGIWYSLHSHRCCHRTRGKKKTQKTLLIPKGDEKSKRAFAIGQMVVRLQMN